ncbi:alkylglycerol monooxygenase-like [Ylistrum balloti]|uniref:alkylglycerol monooxygenase-like n=1 Tax=Ylistrum balloti TaxID=509963 RepID=UPI002905BEC3|nr:alkylglycerol monooxygenase-like [Ylistrum balloti]
MEDALKTSTVGLRRLFYMVTPNETSFKDVEDVPKYIDEALPVFILLVMIEIPILFVQGKPLPRFNDTFSSLAAGIISEFHNLLFRGTNLATYIWVYERWNIISLPWDSPWTWLFGLVFVDFGYYWVHRTGHEMNIMWAGHQTHHSSEDYNLSTALRQSAIHRYFNWMFYLPLALFMPPSVFLVHLQFNLLYQFWIHTETVRSVGPLEWILNTPSHHRVHHGRNPYCIDKNYAGVFIVFDRLFGTFQAEEEKVIYGLVHPLQTWDPINAQICHFKYMIQKVQEEKGFSNKMGVIFKGPGWSPGKPWTGLPEDIPEVKEPVQKYDKDVPLWTNLYIFFHFALMIVASGVVAKIGKGMSPISVVAFILYMLFSLTSFGAIYDNRSYAPIMELFRCGAFLVVTKFTLPVTSSMVTLGYGLSLIYVASAGIWLCISLRQNLLVRKVKAL